MLRLPTPLSELDSDFINYFGKPTGLWIPISNDEPEAKARDFALNNNAGILNGNINNTNDNIGILDNNWKLDGISGTYINLKKLSLTNKLTAVSLFKISSTSSSQVCFAQTDFTTGNAFVMFVSDTANLKWRIGTPSDSNVIAPLPSINNWHMTVGTYDGTTSKLYLDGNLVGSASVTGNFYDSSNVELHIGDYGASSGNSSNLSGLIALTAAWTQSVLTGPQISSLYSSLLYGEPFKLFQPSVFERFYSSSQPSVPLNLTSKSFVFSSAYGKQSINRSLRSETVSRSEFHGNISVQTLTQFQLLSFRRYSSQYFVQGGYSEDNGQ